MELLVTRSLSDIGGGGGPESAFGLAPGNIGSGMGTFVAGWLIVRVGVVRPSTVVGNIWRDCVTTGATGAGGPRLPV